MKQAGLIIAWCIYVLNLVQAIQIAGTNPKSLDRGIYLDNTSRDFGRESSNVLPIRPLENLFRRSGGRPRPSSVVRPQEANHPSTSTRQTQTAAQERSQSPTHSSGSGRNENPAQSPSSGSGAYRSPRSRSQSPPSSPPSSGARSAGSTSSSDWSSHSSGGRTSGRSSSSASSGTHSDTDSSHGSRRSSVELGWPHDIIPPTAARIRASGPAILGWKTTTRASEPETVGPQHEVALAASSPFKTKVFASSFSDYSHAVAKGDVAKAHIHTGPESAGRLTAYGPEGEHVKHVGPSSHESIRVASDVPGLRHVKATGTLVGDGVLGAEGRNLRRRAFAELNRRVGLVLSNR